MEGAAEKVTPSRAFLPPLCSTPLSAESFLNCPAEKNGCDEGHSACESRGSGKNHQIQKLDISRKNEKIIKPRFWFT